MASHPALRPPSTAKSILLVDDDPSLRRAMMHTLQGAGYLVTTATDGTAALRMLATTPTFDLVVVDIFMPGRDGFDVLEAMRRQPRQLPVLVISGGGIGADGPEALHQAKLLGASAILGKPFMPDELLDAVSAALATTSLK